jgi:hypothetical protein
MRRRLSRIGAIAAIAAAIAGTAIAGVFPDGPGGPRIAVVNNSTVLTDDQIGKALPMLQLYLEQVCAAWHCDGTLYQTSAPTERDWLIVINDESDDPFAIGYHESQGSRPVSYVSAGTAAGANVPWTVVFTHELGEMLVDAPASLAAQTNHPVRPPAFTALEIADPVQGRSYRLGDVVVSDYVYRSWFTPGARGPYDSMRVLSAPLQLARESWAAEFRDGHWTTRQTFTHARARWDSFRRGP